LAFFNIGNNYQRLNDSNSAVIYYGKAFATKGGEKVYIDFTPNNTFYHYEFDVPGHEISYERAIAFYQLDSLIERSPIFSIPLAKALCLLTATNELDTFI
jgi:hypothetical protein